VPIGFGVLTTEHAGPGRGPRRPRPLGTRVYATGSGRRYGGGHRPQARPAAGGVSAKRHPETVVKRTELPYYSAYGGHLSMSAPLPRSDGGLGGTSLTPSRRRLYENKSLICKDCGAPFSISRSAIRCLRGKGFRERTAALPRLAGRRVNPSGRWIRHERFPRGCSTSSALSAAKARRFRSGRTATARSTAGPVSAPKNATSRLLIERFGGSVGRGMRSQVESVRHVTETPFGILDQRALPQAVVRERAPLRRRGRRRKFAPWRCARRPGDRHLRWLRCRTSGAAPFRQRVRSGRATAFAKHARRRST